MSMTMPDPKRTIVLKDYRRDDPSPSAPVCLRAARLARTIASYAPAPWRERLNDRIEMSGGEDARIVWMQDLATQGRNGMQWRTRIQMWEPMPCGDSLRTLQITLPDGIPPETLRPDGMLDLATFLTTVEEWCRASQDAETAPWIPHAIAAHAVRSFSSGTMMPECGWLPHRFEGDLTGAVPEDRRIIIGRTVPPIILVSTSIETTEDGMEMHDLRIRQASIDILPTDPVTGLRALERYSRIDDANPDTRIK